MLFLRMALVNRLNIRGIVLAMLFSSVVSNSKSKAVSYPRRIIWGGYTQTGVCKYSRRFCSIAATEPSKFLQGL